MTIGDLFSNKWQRSTLEAARNEKQCMLALQYEFNRALDPRGGVDPLCLPLYFVKRPGWKIPTLVASQSFLTPAFWPLVFLSNSLGARKAFHSFVELLPFAELFEIKNAENEKMHVRLGNNLFEWTPPLSAKEPSLPTIEEHASPFSLHRRHPLAQSPHSTLSINYLKELRDALVHCRSLEHVHNDLRLWYHLDSNWSGPEGLLNCERTICSVGSEGLWVALSNYRVLGQCEKKSKIRIWMGWSKGLDVHKGQERLFERRRKFLNQLNKGFTPKGNKALAALRTSLRETQGHQPLEPSRNDERTRVRPEFVSSVASSFTKKGNDALLSFLRVRFEAQVERRPIAGSVESVEKERRRKFLDSINSGFTQKGNIALSRMRRLG